MSEVTKVASGRCLNCGRWSDGASLVNVMIDAMAFTLCESCAEDLRDNLTEAVGAPED